MNIIKREFNLDQQGFDFGDDFDKVISFTGENNKIVDEEKKYIKTKEIIFNSYIFSSFLFFSDKKLKKIKLCPLFRYYLTEEEFRNHDSNAALRFSKDVIRKLTEHYSITRQNEYEILFNDGNIIIRLVYSRDFDGFDIEVTNE